MLIQVPVNTKGWNKDTRKEYEKNVKMMAVQLARAINQDPEKFMEDDKEN